MTHIAKESPRGTAPTTNRKPHTKSRTGCYGCKARRVKCPETRPVCDNCRFRKLDCVYPSQFKSQSHHVTRLLQPNDNNKNYAAGVLLPPPSTKPVVVLSQFPPFFTIDDMRFFHHYMISAHPYLPYGSDTMWAAEIPILAHQHEFLMHAILSLGASHLSLVGLDHSGPEEAPGYAAMLSHRGLALHGLQQSINKQSQAGPTTTTTIPKLNAMLATCYALTVQSGHMRDGFADFLILMRGCRRLKGHIVAVCGGDSDTLPLNLDDFDLRTLFPHLAGNEYSEDFDDDHDGGIETGIDMGIVKRTADAVRALTPLLRHECHRSYHTVILDVVELLQRRAWIDAFISFHQTYMVLCVIDEASFQEYVISPAGAGVEVEVEKNTVFLILFVHFTALQAVMFPIIWQSMPERARFPQLLLPRIRWLIEISMQLPEALRRYVAVPLEIVGRLGAQYGVFSSEVGQRVKEGLIGRVKELRQAL
ncbi:hypothetical protein EMCG_08854 [[Emmonsia] crescens]|uniref:Zn(2)-C6 fungal-type domain-containing protein n=1 Tax=[Emmonsia] crescens TaxID=73230 RepID=A0A0G2I4G7_9EURO|nr:hypothetical protein EMCG_08854 [Emmonsia crescens UAMH 3008]